MKHTCHDHLMPWIMCQYCCLDFSPYWRVNPVKGCHESPKRSDIHDMAYQRASNKRGVLLVMYWQMAKVHTAKPVIRIQWYMISSCSPLDNVAANVMHPAMTNHVCNGCFHIMISLIHVWHSLFVDLTYEWHMCVWQKLTGSVYPLFGVINACEFR